MAVYLLRRHRSPDQAEDRLQDRTLDEAGRMASVVEEATLAAMAGAEEEVEEVADLTTEDLAACLLASGEEAKRHQSESQALAGEVDEIAEVVTIGVVAAEEEADGSRYVHKHTSNTMSHVTGSDGISETYHTVKSSRPTYHSVSCNPCGPPLCVLESCSERQV
jgi:hypothetical protein